MFPFGGGFGSGGGDAWDPFSMVQQMHQRHMAIMQQHHDAIRAVHHQHLHPHHHHHQLPLHGAAPVHTSSASSSSGRGRFDEQMSRAAGTNVHVEEVEENAGDSNNGYGNSNGFYPQQQQQQQQQQQLAAFHPFAPFGGLGAFGGLGGFGFGGFGSGPGEPFDPNNPTTTFSSTSSSVSYSMGPDGRPVVQRSMERTVRVNGVEESQRAFHDSTRGEAVLAHRRAIDGRGIERVQHHRHLNDADRAADSARAEEPAETEVLYHLRPDQTEQFSEEWRQRSRALPRGGVGSVPVNIPALPSAAAAPAPGLVPPSASASASAGGLTHQPRRGNGSAASSASASSSAPGVTGEWVDDDLFVVSSTANSVPVASSSSASSSSSPSSSASSSSSTPASKPRWR